jgi:hypothetical protein
MRPSNLLFELVKSLDAEEQSSFRQISSLQQGDKNYLKIFNYLSTINDYDEEKVKQHFKSEQFVRHFPSEKNQLMHHILRALRIQRQHDNTGAYVNEQVKNIRILFNKSLYRLARRELNRIKVLAWKHELFYSLLEIIELEKEVIDIEVRFDESDMSMLNELMKEKERVLDQLANLEYFENLLSDLYSRYNKYSFARDEQELAKTEKLLNSRELNDSNRQLSRKAVITASLCKTFACRLVHKNHQIIDNALVTIRLFEQDETIIAEKPMYYLMSYSFLARAYALNHQYNECFNCLDKIRSLQISPPFSPLIFQIGIFTRSVINDSMFYLYTGQFEKHQKMIPYILRGMEKYEGKIPYEELCTLHFVLFMSYFGMDNHSQSLVWLNHILNAPEKEVRPDLHRISRMVNLILHFEMKNFSLLTYLIKSTQRYYDSHSDIYAFEKIFIRYFRKLSSQNKKGDTEKFYEKLKTELNDAFNDPFQRFALEFFDFEAWINSKLHGLSYGQALRTARQAK